MLNVVLGSVFNSLLMDTNTPLTVNAADFLLRATLQIGDINFDPPPNVGTIGLVLSFAFAPQHHVVRHRSCLPWYPT
jgi:hypothetical protein